MVDLHVHSNCSDGSDDCITILKKAGEKGITHLSITDHDNCNAYQSLENMDITKYFSGKLITGVELQAYACGCAIELLGYGVDAKKINNQVKELYLPFAEINRIEMERLHHQLIAAGMKFDRDVLNRYENSGYYYATEYLHQEMRKYPGNKELVPDAESWQSESVFFKRHTSNMNSRFYIDESDLIPSAASVANLIKDAGGLVFIPHIYQYNENWQSIFAFLMNHCQIDGIECYYSDFTKEQTDYLLAYCKENHKYISGGSDYHGQNRPGVELGSGRGNLNIQPEQVGACFLR